MRGLFFSATGNARGMEEYVLYRALHRVAGGNRTPGGCGAPRTRPRLGLDSLPADLHEQVVKKLSHRDQAHLRAASTAHRDSDLLRNCRTLGALARFRELLMEWEDAKATAKVGQWVVRKFGSVAGGEVCLRALAHPYMGLMEDNVHPVDAEAAAAFERIATTVGDAHGTQRPDAAFADLQRVHAVAPWSLCQLGLDTVSTQGLGRIAPAWPPWDAVAAVVEACLDDRPGYLHVNLGDGKFDNRDLEQLLAIQHRGFSSDQVVKAVPWSTPPQGAMSYDNILVAGRARGTHPLYIEEAGDIAKGVQLPTFRSSPLRGIELRVRFGQLPGWSRGALTISATVCPRLVVVDNTGSALGPAAVALTRCRFILDSAFADPVWSSLEGCKFPLQLESIGYCAFAGCTSLTALDLRMCSSLGAIGKWAFVRCRAVQTVRLPRSLYAIGDGAFQSCTGLSELVLPSLSFLGRGAFENCETLQAVDMAACKSLRVIMDSTFERCGSLATLTLPASLVAIENSAFSGTGLQTLDLSRHPDLYMDSNAFYNCRSLKTVALPTTATSIANAAFRWCSALQDINLVACTALRHIHPLAFSFCKTLPSVNLSDCATLSHIHPLAFRGCSALHTVNLSGCASLVTLDDMAFWACERLCTVNVAGCTSLAVIGERTFARCTNLVTLDLSPCTALAAIAPSAFEGGRLTDLSLPPGANASMRAVKAMVDNGGHA